MNTAIPPFRRIVIRFLGAAAVIILLGYGLFEARRLIEGPRISIASPRDGSAVAGPIVHVKGSADNAAFFTVNDTQSFIDENGQFDKAFSPPPGYTVLTVRAKDRFGRIASKSIHVTVVDYCPAAG